MDVEFDVRFQIFPGTGTTRLRMGVVGSSDRASSAISAIELNASSTKVVRIGWKENSPGAFPTYTYNSGVLSAEIRRIRLILRKENWNVGATGREVEVYAYDVADTLIGGDSTTLAHGLDPKLWNTGVEDSNNPNTAWAAFFLEFNAGGGTESAVISQADVIYRNQSYTLDTVFGPYLDWASTEMPRLPAASQPYMNDSKIIASGAPFNANNAGGGTSATNLTAILDAGKNAAEYGMDLFFEEDSEYVVNNQIFFRQFVSQRTSSAAGDRQSFIDETRGYVLQGSNQGANKPKLRLANGSSGYGTVGSPKVFVLIENADYNPEPPSGTNKPNSLYNNGVINLWLDTGTNVGAIALDMQGAQGQEIIRIKITGSGYAGIRNGNGAGGSQLTGDIDGFQYGLLLCSVQPGCVFSGYYLTNQTVSAIYCGPSIPSGGDTGPRNTVFFVGTGITMDTSSVGKLAVDGGSMGTGQSVVEQGYMEFTDGYIDFSTPQTANVAFETNRPFVVENFWVRNCTKILEHPKGDVTSPASTGWVYIKRLIVPHNLTSPSVGNINANIAAELPGTNGVDHELVSNSTPFNTNSRIDGVDSSANTVEIYADGHANFIPVPADIVDRHRVSDAEFKTWEDATINVATDYAINPLTGLVDNTTFMDAAMSDSVVGDVIYLRRGYWLRNNTYDLLEGRHLVGSNKASSNFVATRFPTAGQPFGSSDSPQRPMLRTADSTLPSTVATMNIWRHHGMPTGFAIHWRGNNTSYSFLTRRNTYWGFINYASTPEYDASAPLVQWTDNATGKHFMPNQGVIYNTQSPYCHYEFRDIVGSVSAYAINPEHTHNWPGNIHIINCHRVNIFGSKCEANAPFINCVDSTFVALHALTGNSSGHIPRANVPIGEVVTTPASTRGYNPAPTGFYPSPYSPALVYVRNVANYRISQVQDEGRFWSAEFHGVFGGGTRPDYWHFGVEGGTNTQTYLMPPWRRPVYWGKGDMTEAPDPPESGVITKIMNYFRRRQV